ncbi:hypothetical protein [Lactococcus petauri]|uniref:hypothetical protein n=1 Tax=Lactococcus petauri TaxID=1940789 RepID=UPI0018AB0435|nr:hypothetical protein [Lactococcus petauri]MDC0826896.1 hypothetical protein [Lactococcus petauri]
MTKTAKELIENELKSVEKSISTGRQFGKTYKYGVREGLMIALAHIHNAATLVTSEETVMINKEIYDLLIDKVNKQREQLAVAVEALKEVERSKYGMQFRRDRNPAIAKQALAEIGGEDE